MRLIDADALRQRMYHEAFETDTELQKWDSGCWIRYKLFENCIDEMPTISPDDVRGVGEWIYDDFDGDGLDYHCPFCKQYSRVNWDYCPSCGARMKGAEDGTTD